MGVYSGPKTVPDGLVFAYDMANTKKSWIGEPTTNLMTNPVPVNTSGYVAFGGTGTVTFNNIQNAVRWVRNTYNAWGAYLNFGPIFNGTLDTLSQYTISFLWKTENKNIFPNSVYFYELVQNNGVSAAASANLLLNSILRSDGWFEFKYTFTPANTGVNAYNRIILGTQGTNSSIFYIKNVQFEKLPRKTPFIETSRTGTQAVLDLTKNNIINISSLTYDSAGSFSFVGPNEGGSSIGDYLFVSDNPSINFSTGSFTLVFLTYRSGNGGFQGGSYISKGNGTTIGFDFRDNNFYVHGSLGLIASIPFSANFNVWQHHVLVFNKNSNPFITRFLNGVYFSQSNVNNPVNLSSINTVRNLEIGRSQAGGHNRYFSGKLPFVQLYNRALTDIEIKENFESVRRSYNF